MQSDPQRELEQLGFSERQARVYLSLLQFGKCGVMQLYLALGIPRSSCYDTLQQLVTQGLIVSDHEDGQQVFVCEPPERILSLLRLQTEEVKLRQQRADQFVPYLNALANSGSDRPKVRVLADADEILAIHADIADMHEPILQIVAYDAFVATQTSTALQERRRRLQRLRSHGRAIIVSAAPFDPPPGINFEVRRIPPDILSFKGEITVCGHRVLLAAFAGSILAIDIVSPSLADTCRQTLELAWQRAGEIEKLLKTGET